MHVAIIVKTPSRSSPAWFGLSAVSVGDDNHGPIYQQETLQRIFYPADTLHRVAGSRTAQVNKSRRIV